MSTFTELQNRVMDWSLRDDVAPVLPVMIKLAEQRNARVIRVLGMETDGNIDIDSRGESVLPEGFLGFRHVAVNNEVRPTAEFLPPDQFNERRIGGPFGYITNQGERNIFYTIEANKIKILPVPAEENTVSLNTTYFARFPALSDSQPTNWLLDNAFDIYLWGTLREVAIYINDNNLQAKFEALYSQSVEELHNQQKRLRSRGTALRRNRRRGTTP